MTDTPTTEQTEAPPAEEPEAAPEEVTPDPTQAPSDDSSTDGTPTGDPSPTPPVAPPADSEPEAPAATEPTTSTTTDADGNEITVDANGDVLPAVGSTPSDPSGAVPAPVATPVVPAASETPDPADAAPIEQPGVLLPTDGNWSTQQIELAEKLGLPSPSGQPLSSAARETLRGLREAISGIRSWCDYAERVISKIPE